jgi:hypothetical protein
LFAALSYRCHHFGRTDALKIKRLVANQALDLA